ncbi:peptide ABC transporter permease [Staphylococcus equorum]|uniref:peptide ABC transporter permease n=1 Tax=Staphylococcus TaxID=1279 RepID=UPI000852F583|nr:peptide ABC transporter permease [Staphylococcus equorum]MDG0822798.1 peptide ABC transporter permease [Staphylococcus equorum]MDG0837021.1 peptide ABC transporter permease [Staphylococcus equorum]MDK9871613.1 peptide ABC transporter permease [Staphylococcus equorum]MDK9877816.1 peptide ABC transporter permease [Staphylococcus equorum]MDN5828680.1 peptide ABC transporter permease [Staphylococcus equorum]
MLLEFKKSISNKIILTLGILFIFVFLLGYFLPVGIDKVSNLTYGQYFFSTYTVATEFGFLLFSFIIAYFINKEYSNKNTLFYKLLGDNVFKFFYKKAAILFIESLIFLTIGLTIISAVFSNFSHFLLLLTLFSLVLLQYILIIGTISVLSPNVLISIGISIIYWIGSIILVAINKTIFGIIAPFEASNSIYPLVEQVLNGNKAFLPANQILTIFIFFLILFVVNFMLLIFAKKRWLKLGL